MSSAGGSRAFVVSMSLTELAFILFFLLLLLALARDMIRQKEVTALARDAGAWTDLTEALREEDLTPDTWSDDTFRKLVRDAAMASELSNKTEDLASRLHEADKQVKEAQSAAAAATTKAQFVTRQLDVLQNQCGVGYPPCWVGVDGKIDYIYRIMIGEESLSVEAGDRPQELFQVPKASALIGRTLSLAEFRQPAQAVLDWSKAQNPECRHYVVLIDRAQTKDGYKKKRLVIENFFYKFESRS